MIRRFAILLLVCGGLGFFLHREQSRGTFDAWERFLLDEVRRLAGPPPSAPPVVLIELRRGDLPFESWPPAPLDYALVFESLLRRQPRQVVVQPLLAWPGAEPLDVATLAERIALLPRGVLACTLQRGADEAAVGPAVPVPLPVLPGASGDRSKVPDFALPGQVPVDDLRMGKALGFTRIEFGQGVSVHGDTVAVPLLARRGGDLVPSLALQALLVWRQAAPGEVMIQLGRRLTLGGSLATPIDSAGRLRLSARLAPPLRRLDAGALLLDLDRDEKLLVERSGELATLRSLDGALVVLGETGETTPRFAVSGASDGGWTEAEVLARSLVAALSGFHLREPEPRWLWAGWALVVLAGAALLGCPRRWLPVFALGGASALALGLTLTFLHGQWWIPPVPPLGLWLAASLVAFILPPARPPAPGEPAIPPATGEAGVPALGSAPAACDGPVSAAAAGSGMAAPPAVADPCLRHPVPAPPAGETVPAQTPATEPAADPPMGGGSPGPCAPPETEDDALETLAHELARDEGAGDGNGSKAGAATSEAGQNRGPSLVEPVQAGVPAAARTLKPGRRGHRSAKGRPTGGGGRGDIH